MHVAVFGAGALGRVYGVRLAARAGVDVSFVVRAARTAETAPFVVESAWNDRREQISPLRVATVPPEADVVLLTVGAEDLPALAGPLATTSAPIVVVTPMMPQDWERMRGAYGERVFAAYPTVSAYVRTADDVVRYWTLPAPTLIDEPRGEAPAVRALAAELGRAGVRTAFKLGVHESNPATTVAFIPIGMGLAVAGSAAALAEDEDLCALVGRACREGGRLGDRIGAMEPYAFMFPILATRWALTLAFRALPREPLFFLEEHFGRKIAAQHRVMIRQMIELAESKGLPHDALDELAARLDHSA